MQTLLADYFDGRSSKPIRVRLSVAADMLHVQAIESDGIHITFPLAQVRWSERTRHGARTATLDARGMLHCLDAQEWDAFVAAQVRADSLVVRAQQSWRALFVALVLLVVGAAALYAWGLPWLAKGLTPLIPQTVDRTIGESTLARLDGTLLSPSKVTHEMTQRLSNRFAAELRKNPKSNALHHQLVFRSSRIGPNAFALPDGTIVVTDELVKLANNEDMVLGVIGHEWGHVLHRHALRQLIQVGAVQAAISVAMGDYAGVLTTAPVILASMGYSRDFEREADEESVRFMRSAGISPALMADFFERMHDGSTEKRADKNSSGLNIGIFASHPDDEERIAFFRRAALGQ